MADALGAFARVLWQVAGEGEVLPVQAAGGQCQQQRNRACQWLHPGACVVRGTYHGAAGIGHGGHAGFADQAHVVARQQRRDERRGVELAGVVALLVHFAWQFGDVLLLQRRSQRVQGVDALEVGTAALGVLADPVGELCGTAQRAFGQHVLQGCLRVAAEVQRRGHQIERADSGCGVHGSVRPAARSMRQVRIKGRPTRAVGSSLTMASSRLMPRPSLLALPAQS